MAGDPVPFGLIHTRGNHLLVLPFSFFYFPYCFISLNFFIIWFRFDAWQEKFKKIEDLCAGGDDEQFDFVASWQNFVDADYRDFILGNTEDTEEVSGSNDSIPKKTKLKKADVSCF